MYFQWASYPYPGIPTKSQEDEFKPTKSIIKNTPRETEKGVIKRQTSVDKHKGDKWTFPQRYNIMKQIMTTGQTRTTICLYYL